MSIENPSKSSEDDALSAEDEMAIVEEIRESVERLNAPLERIGNLLDKLERGSSVSSASGTSKRYLVRHAIEEISGRLELLNHLDDLRS